MDDLSRRLDQIDSKFDKLNEEQTTQQNSNFPLTIKSCQPALGKGFVVLSCRVIK